MILPYEDRFRVKVPEIRKVYSGFDKFFHKLNGYSAARRFDSKKLLEKAERIVNDSFGLQDKHIDKLLEEFQVLFKDNNDSDMLLTYLCEISSRVMGMRPYSVQVMGVLVIMQSAIAEMATGEGKTLTASLAAIMFAAEKKPVHVLTSNDYLAERDSEQGKPLFDACKVSVSFVGSQIEPEKRQQRYTADIVYTTAKELLSDYLRDRIKLGSESSDLERTVDYTLKMFDKTSGLTLQGIHSVVIDEADNILIDEAVIPLIISAKRENIPLREAAISAYECAENIMINQDYTIDLRLKLIKWTNSGDRKLKEISGRLPKMWSGFERAKELIETALYAREFLKKDEHYIIDDGKIVLIDNLTGRLTPMRNLGIGLQQAVEAKEEIEVTDPTETIGRMSFQRFFRLFPKIGGMSGTVREVKDEIWQIYHTPIVEIPTYRPVIRKELPWRFFLNYEKKVEAIIEDVISRYEAGQPVLLGTRSVGISEDISERLKGRIEEFNILNAVRHAQEAEIVEKAGQKKNVTIATNMAGRGTDIKLGENVRELGGLCVICAEPQASRRLDRQLFGRAGRQGDPGEAWVFVSLDDIIIRTFLSRLLKFPVKLLFKMNMPFSNHLLKKIIFNLQRRSEDAFAKQRLSILKSDDWIEKFLTFPKN